MRWRTCSCIDHASPRRAVRVSAGSERTNSSRRAGVPRRRSTTEGKTPTGRLKSNSRSNHFVLLIEESSSLVYSRALLRSFLLVLVIENRLDDGERGGGSRRLAVEATREVDGALQVVRSEFGEDAFQIERLGTVRR